MGRLSRLLKARGAPGSTARWVARNYKQLGASYPYLSHQGIVHTMISNRYVGLPSKSQEIAVRSLVKDSPDLGDLVIAILTAEAGLGEIRPSARSEIVEVVEAELEKSGLPRQVRDSWH